MEFRAVIFDFDGVLIDSEIVNIEAGVRGFAAFGYELTQEDRKTILGRHSEDYTRMFQKKYNLPESIIGDLLSNIDEEYDSMFESFIRLKPDVKETIGFLKSKGVSLSIATGNELMNVQKFVEKFGFQDIFDHFTTFEDVTKRKPDPEVYVVAKEKTGLPVKEILAIEDTGIGIEAAKGAGLVCVAIPTEHTQKQDLLGADYVFGSMRELVKLFE